MIIKFVILLAIFHRTSIVKYVATLCDYFNIKKNIFEDNCHYCKIIYENLSNLIDYINENVCRNIKILINLLKKININKLLIFKNKYGYQYFDILINLDLASIVNYNIPIYIFNNNNNNNKMLLSIKFLYEKYNNNKHLTNFMNLIKPNINKLTQYNADNLFNMFIITHGKYIGI